MRIVRMLMADPLGEPLGGQDATACSAEPAAAPAPASPAGSNVSAIEVLEEHSMPGSTAASLAAWPRGFADAAAVSPAGCEASVVECHEAQNGASHGSAARQRLWPRGSAGAPAASPARSEDSVVECPEAAIDSPGLAVDEQLRAGAAVDGQGAVSAPGSWRPVEAARDCEGEAATDGCGDEGCAAGGVLAMAARFGRTVQRRASAAPRVQLQGAQAAADDSAPWPEPSTDGAMGIAKVPANAAAGATEPDEEAPAESNHARHLGALALGTIDRALAGRISCTSSLQELESIPLPFAVRPVGPSPQHLGTWMIWTVHRLALDDPSLTELDFSSYAMPLPEDEPRIAPKLWVALARNTHLRRLLLEDANLRISVDNAARGPAAALASNRHLRVLNISSNFLGPRDLQTIFEALHGNVALEELRCSNQFCEPADLAAYKALAEALRQGCSLRKLGLELRDSHHRDQINRALVRNADAGRRRLRHRRLGGG